MLSSSLDKDHSDSKHNSPCWTLCVSSFTAGLFFFFGFKAQTLEIFHFTVFWNMKPCRLGQNAYSAAQTLDLTHPQALLCYTQHVCTRSEFLTGSWGGNLWDIDRHQQKSSSDTYSLLYWRLFDLKILTALTAAELMWPTCLSFYLFFSNCIINS